MKKKSFGDLVDHVSRGNHADGVQPDRELGR